MRNENEERMIELFVEKELVVGSILFKKDILKGGIEPLRPMVIKNYLILMKKF